MHFRSFCVLLLSSSTAVLACATEADSATVAANRGPVLDSVDVPTELTAVDGLYKIPVTILWSDPDGDAVAKIRYQVLAANVDRTREAPAGSLGVKMEILVAGTVEKKTYEILFTAFDAKGLEGDTVTKAVTFQ